MSQELPFITANYLAKLSAEGAKLMATRLLEAAWPKLHAAAAEGLTYKWFSASEIPEQADEELLKRLFDVYRTADGYVKISWDKK